MFKLYSRIFSLSSCSRVLEDWTGRGSWNKCKNLRFFVNLQNNWTGRCLVIDMSNICVVSVAVFPYLSVADTYQWQWMALLLRSWISWTKFVYFRNCKSQFCFFSSHPASSSGLSRYRVVVRILSISLTRHWESGASSAIDATLARAKRVTFQQLQVSIPINPLVR